LVASGVNVAVGVAATVGVTTGKGVVCTRVCAVPGLGVLVQVGVNVGRKVGALVTSNGAVGSAGGDRTYT
jgi:hypothetical protein